MELSVRQMESIDTSDGCDSMINPLSFSVAMRYQKYFSKTDLTGCLKDCIMSKQLFRRANFEEWHYG